MFIDILIGMVWVIVCCYVLMIVCDRYFVESLDVIAHKRKLSESVAGATIMAIWSSSPELFTALIALLKWWNVWLGAGTIIGSAIFNILVINWLSALFLKTYLKSGSFWKDAFFYTWFVVLIAISFWDGIITFRESAVYIIWYTLYVITLIQENKHHNKDSKMIEEVSEETELIEKETEKKLLITYPIDRLIGVSFPRDHMLKKQYLRVFMLSLVWIGVTTHFLVESGILLAHTFGVSDVIIGLTILAIGTSLPDTLSSVIVAKKWRADMAISNAQGSNIFNIWICLGLPRILYILWYGQPINISNDDFTLSLSMLFGVMIIFYGSLWLQGLYINKTIGYLFLGVYLIYFSWTIWSAVG